MPQGWWALRPWAMAGAAIEAIVLPWATAVRLLAESPPSNSTISASMQRSAKKPSPRATNGGVWTTLGGVTETPILTLRIWLQACFGAGAAPAVKTCGDGLASAGAPAAAGLAAGTPAGWAASVGFATGAAGGLAGAGAQAPTNEASSPTAPRSRP